jgi:hypothetical protein
VCDYTSLSDGQYGAGVVGNHPFPAPSVITISNFLERDTSIRPLCSIIEAFDFIPLAESGF